MIDSLVSRCRGSVHIISIERCLRVNLESLAGCIALRTLRLHLCRDVQAASALMGCENLRTLQLSVCGGISQDAVEQWRSHTALSSFLVQEDSLDFFVPRARQLQPPSGPSSRSSAHDPLRRQMWPDKADR